MNKEEILNLNIPHARCSICGRFMRRLKLIEKIRLGLLPEVDNKHTHICKRESISYETGEIEHE